jgi:hypothetical protein
MTSATLREFVCKQCGHTVVVKPNLPADYMPNICTPCLEMGESGRQRKMAEMMLALDEFIDWLKRGGEGKPGPHLEALRNRIDRQRANRAEIGDAS